MSNVEWLGIVGTIFIMCSYATSKVFWLRFINIFGSAFFIVYGVLTKTWSTAALNAMCILVNVYKMYAEHKQPSSNNEEKLEYSEDDRELIHGWLKATQGLDEADLDMLDQYVKARKFKDLTIS